ncbi:hypothetical protein Taro_057013 [Colocasia esculenta]|uniref:Uncharacterized protein n=1 Tax=Colocasia esculenta TaxID=4460 RepID=A0A843XVE3_COLES|nr:hypothetical protein [Colocasia esculenta]
MPSKSPKGWKREVSAEEWEGEEAPERWEREGAHEMWEGEGSPERWEGQGSTERWEGEGPTEYDASVSMSHHEKSAHYQKPSVKKIVTGTTPLEVLTLHRYGAALSWTTVERRPPRSHLWG